MYLHDQFVERSTYALNEQTNKYPNILDDLKDVCLVRKIRNQDEEHLNLENNLIARVLISEQEQLFDSFCIRGTFQEMANLLIDCSNGLAFSSQPKVQYNNMSKQYIVSDSIWFSPYTYQSCANWIMNELEKAIALMYFKHKQGYVMQSNSINDLNEFWKNDQETIKSKIVSQLPQLQREFQNANKKKKAQQEDIQWAQFLYKLAPQSLQLEGINAKLMENNLDSMQFMTLHQLCDVSTLLQRRIMSQIKQFYKERIMKDLIEIEQREKQRQCQKKQKKKSKKQQGGNQQQQQIKSQNTPSTASQRDNEHKSLNLQELVEQLKHLELTSTICKNKKSYFTTPPNSPLECQEIDSNNSNTIPLSSIIQYSYLQCETDKQELKIESENENENDDESWNVITRKHGRKFSSQIDLAYSKKKKHFNKQKLQCKKQIKPFQQKTAQPMKQLPSIVDSLRSQEIDSDKNLSVSTREIEIVDNSIVSLELPQEPTTIEGIQLDQLNSESIQLSCAINSKETKATNPIPSKVTQIINKSIPTEKPQIIAQHQQQQQNQVQVEQPIDQLVMDQAFQFMIKKLDLDMKELNDQILIRNEAILPIRQLIFNRVQYIVKELFTDSNTDIRLYGSCATGLSLPESDIDIGIFGFEIVPTNQLHIPIQMLSDFLQEMKWIRSVRTIVNTTLPIIKLQVDPYISFTQSSLPYQLPYIDIDRQAAFGPQQCFNVDVTFFQFRGPQTYEHLGLISTELTLQWSQYYSELRPLTLLFKSLLKKRGLNDQYKGGISSFCIIQMVLAFLEYYYAQNKVSSLGMATYRFFEFYGGIFNPQTTGIHYQSFGQYPFFELCENELEIAIVSPINNEMVSTSSSFVQTILQDLNTLHQATHNEVQFFYDKIKFNKKKRGKKEERNLFLKEINKLNPLFGSTGCNI